MAAMKMLLITKCTCWFLHNMYVLWALPMYLKLIEMTLDPFSKQNAFNKSRKDGKFGTDSMHNTLRALELAMFLLFLPHENINTSSVEQILF